MKTYFASFETKQEDFLAELNTRIDMYYDYLRNRGTLALWRQIYTLFYKPKWTSGKVVKVGEELEFKSLQVNHLANIVQHQVTMITQDEIAWDARAVNSDIVSQSQAKFATQLLEAEVKIKKIENLDALCTFYSNMFGEGWWKIAWDATAGKDYISTEETEYDPEGSPILEPTLDEQNEPIQDPETLEPVMQERKIPVAKKSGDTTYTVHMPIDVARDVYARTHADCRWRSVRTLRNKYEVAASVADPELKTKIVECSEKDRDGVRDLLYPATDMLTNIDEDGVFVQEFFHDRTEAVPDGRYTVIVGRDIIIYDGVLPYEETPLYRLAGQEETETPMGWSTVYDIASIQDALNKLYSIVTTNQLKFGVGVVVVPKGSGYSSSTLAKGMKIIEVDPRAPKPEILTLLQTKPEIFQFISQLEAVLEKISSVSSVMRGDPAASVRSGNMLEIILAENHNFYKGLERSRKTCLEKLGTAFIKIMQQYADAERPVALMGKNGRYYTKYFNSENLENVEQIYVEQGNPIQKSFAGKMTIARDLLNSGALKDPREYIQILTTGNLDSATDPDTMDFMLIQEENEALMEGKPVVASITDYQACHGYHHTVVLANPAARQDQAIVEAVNDHLGQHATMAGFILPGGNEPQFNPDRTPMVEPQLDQQGNIVLDQEGKPVLQQVISPIEPDILGYLNWCRMIMNAPPSGQMQVAQQAMMIGAQGMAPPEQKMNVPVRG